MRPKKIKRQRSERARDSVRIASMYLNGSNQTEIAKELKISQPTVSREIKLLEGEWKERSSKDIATWKAGEVAYLLTKRRELEDIWKLSQNRLNVIKTKRATMVQGVVTQQEVSEREELELADTKIGQLLLSVADRLSALIGMDAPKKQELTGKDGAPLQPPAEIETVRTLIKDG
jgi:DNA-binding MarR family transcriptional regulator